MSNIWFTSDTHFGSKSLHQWYPLRASLGDYVQQTEAMIERWNSVVQSKDIVYHIGDFGSYDEVYNTKVIRQLKGRIHLVPGNHDKRLLKNTGIIERCSLIYTERVVNVSVNGQPIVLCHFPIWEWHNIHRGYWHLHGHLHCKPHGIPGKIMDVSSDGHNLTPISFDYIKTQMDLLPVRLHH